MNSLLVVEDEKLIRQGIVTMIKRSGVPVEEILECRNGEDALELLRSRYIDVMFTDIRMPKMDGIALIGHLNELETPPKTIVISGYDDFSYAVEALRGGVRDYLLKPIEREKVRSILEKLEQELEKEQEARNMSNRFERQQLRYVIINKSISEEEFAVLEKNFDDSQTYRICCCSCGHSIEQEKDIFIQFTGIEEQSVFFVQEEGLDRLLSQLEEYCVGISGTHKGCREAHIAYEESLEARKYAFIAEKHAVTVQDIKDEETEQIPKSFTEKFVQLFGTDKAENGMKQLENYYFQAKRGKVAAGQLLEVTMTVMEQILITYKNMLEMDMSGYVRLRQPLAFNDASAFLTDFKSWILQMKERIVSEFSDYRNKEKINLAVTYIKENYSKELNMAMVSNYISMNYSLFSLSFKQYTGMNFVNYLKAIRIREAKRLLEETDEKIINISQMVGYENEKHFMKTFKNECGVSPSEYRKNMQMGKTLLQ